MTNSFTASFTTSCLKNFAGILALAFVATFCAPAAKAAPTPNACELLTAAQVEQVLGKPVKIQTSRPDECDYFADPRRMLSISIYPVMNSDPAKEIATRRAMVQKISPKHTFQDEPASAPTPSPKPPPSANGSCAS